MSHRWIKLNTSDHESLVDWIGKVVRLDAGEWFHVGTLIGFFASIEDGLALFIAGADKPASAQCLDVFGAVDEDND